MNIKYFFAVSVFILSLSTFAQADVLLRGYYGGGEGEPKLLRLTQTGGQYYYSSWGKYTGKEPTEEYEGIRLIPVRSKDKDFPLYFVHTENFKSLQIQISLTSWEMRRWGAVITEAGFFQPYEIKKADLEKIYSGLPLDYND